MTHHIPPYPTLLHANLSLSGSEGSTAHLVLQLPTAAAHTLPPDHSSLSYPNWVPSFSALRFAPHSPNRTLDTTNRILSSRPSTVNCA